MGGRRTGEGGGVLGWEGCGGRGGLMRQNEAWRVTVLYNSLNCPNVGMCAPVETLASCSPQMHGDVYRLNVFFPCENAALLPAELSGGATHLPIPKQTTMLTMLKWTNRTPSKQTYPDRDFANADGKKTTID